MLKLINEEKESDVLLTESSYEQFMKAAQCVVKKIVSKFEARPFFVSVSKEVSKTRVSPFLGVKHRAT